MYRTNAELHAPTIITSGNAYKHTRNLFVTEGWLHHAAASFESKILIDIFCFVSYLKKTMDFAWEQLFTVYLNICSTISFLNEKINNFFF